MYSYRERYPAATLSTSRLETTSTDDDHNISRLHNAHASRTLIIRSCATHLHTVMYWRRHRNDGRGGRWSQLLSNENTVQVVWQHAWPALTPAAVTSQTNTPPASQLDKNGQSIKCCPRERHTQVNVHVHARHRLNCYLQWGVAGAPEQWKWTFCHRPLYRCQTRVSSVCWVTGTPDLSQCQLHSCTAVHKNRKTWKNGSEYHNNMSYSR